MYGFIISQILHLVNIFFDIFIEKAKIFNNIIVKNQ